MTNKKNKLDKQKILMFIQEARQLAKLYDGENKKHPIDFYDYGCVDAIALHLLEQNEGFITTGVKLRGEDIKILGRRGHLCSDGIFFVEQCTTDYLLEDFTGTTIARFAYNVCDVICGRFNYGDRDLKAIMMDNPVAYARRTQRELESHL